MRIATIFLLLITTNSFSQDLKSIQQAIAANNWLGAKTGVDSLLNDKRYSNDATLWYYKGKVYTEAVRRHEELPPSLIGEALKAYKRYQELDPKNRLMEADRNVGLFQLYDYCYSFGSDRYAESKYEPAYWHFKTALETEEYILKKNFSFNGERYPAVDTQLISLVAFSAYLSNRQEEAIPYFEKLADLRISGEEFKGVYTLLAQHFARRNDAVRAAKYLNTGRQLFPDHAYWLKLEFGNPATEKERFGRYEQLMTKYPEDFELSMDYAIDLFNYCYSANIPADLQQRRQSLQNVLLKALKLQPASATANAVMSEHLYNTIYDAEQAFRKLDPESAADKASIKKISTQLDGLYADLYRYSKKAFDIYSTQTALDVASTQHYRKVLTQLVTYHQKKKEGEEAARYQQKLKSREW